MERARTELLRSVGFEQDQLQQELGIIFAVHSANIQYKKPAKFNDELNVLTSISRIGKASIYFTQSVYQSATENLLVDAEIKIACLNAKDFSPQGIPLSITQKITTEFHCGS
jgi:acyl-CoA thioester hydrolase